ncbi:hypothetical protein G6F65_016063 [Rhizopus arrhizus]|nr:hypothetical protein G6F65_016063 [Rhizopus arrhizus]
MVRQPGIAFRAVVVSARGADFQREILFPVHALGHVGNAEAVGDAHAGVRVDQLPRKLVGADVQAAPALSEGDETRHRHGAFEHHGQGFAFLHVFPIAGGGAAHFFLRIQLVGFLDFLGAVAAGFASAHRFVFAALFAGVVALGAEAPAVGLGDLVAILVEEVHVINLLHRTAGEAGLVLDQVLQVRLGRDHVVAFDGVVPGPVGARPHGVHAGQPAHITRHDAAGRKQEAGQGDDAAVLGLGRVFRVGPQGVVVADAVGVVADVVARGLVAPRFGGGADLHADAGTQFIQAAFGDFGEASFGLGLGQHDVSWGWVRRARRARRLRLKHQRSQALAPAVSGDGSFLRASSAVRGRTPPGADTRAGPIGCAPCSGSLRRRRRRPCGRTRRRL